MILWDRYILENVKTFFFFFKKRKTFMTAPEC